jgi:hypothetical protein
MCPQNQWIVRNSHMCSNAENAHIDNFCACPS